MRIAIVGSRPESMHFNGKDKPLVFKLVVDKIMAILIYHTGNPCLVSGGAAGVDSLAEGMAKGFGLPNIIFHPEWTKYGKSAGFKRNQKIVDAADIIIAFHFNDSHGTADTIRRARESGKPVHVYTLESDGAGIGLAYNTYNVEVVNYV